METYELRYFRSVAKFENVLRAAEELNISPGSVSKAIARLEDELGVQLFNRVGRTIRLTAYGMYLEGRAAEILRLEEETKTHIHGKGAAFQVRVAGPEVLLTRFARSHVAQISDLYPEATFELQPMNESDALSAIGKGQVHLCVTAGEIPKGITAKELFKTSFQTCVGRKHPLYKAAKSEKTIPVQEVLAHSFVCPDRPFLGQVTRAQSFDGWRDDKFPRKVAFVTSGLKLLEELVVGGRAVAYLPDYYVAELDVLPLIISGCPYTCQQSIKIGALKPEQIGWMKTVFSN